MLSIDLIIVLAIIVLVFFRHMTVYKDPNKINYTPIVLSLGIIGALLHFSLYGSDGSELAVLKESFIPVIASVILTAVMSIITQSAAAANAESDRVLLSSISEVTDSFKSSILDFSRRLEHVTQMENTTHEQLRSILKEEIDALNNIQANQKLFVTKIESLLAQQHIAMEKFEDFTLTELPGLDNIVHRHIDLLRIAEQDHFNQLKTAARSTCDEQKQVHSQLLEIKQQFTAFASNPLPEKTASALHKELDRVVYEFARQLQTIGAKSELMVTTLLENDALLKGSREQSELIMQQMVLSSKQMREITMQSRELSDSLKPLNKLFTTAETLNQGFVEGIHKLADLSASLDASHLDELKTVHINIENALMEFNTRIDSMANAVENHPQPLTPPDTKTVHELASKVRLHKSYIGDNQE